ncbi:MAG: hypothetical protein ACRDTD_20390, partial [Pseudonocardiaceae bacterium]
RTRLDMVLNPIPGRSKGDVHCEPLRLESVPEPGGKSFFVLNYQHPHGALAFSSGDFTIVTARTEDSLNAGAYPR